MSVDPFVDFLNCWRKGGMSHAKTGLGCFPTSEV